MHAVALTGPMSSKNEKVGKLQQGVKRTRAHRTVYRISGEHEALIPHKHVYHADAV